MIRWGMPRLLFCFICLAKSIIRYSRELCKACLVQPQHDMTSARRQFRTRRHTAGNQHKISQNDAHGVSAKQLESYWPRRSRNSIDFDGTFAKAAFSFQKFPGWVGCLDSCNSTSNKAFALARSCNKSSKSAFCVSRHLQSSSISSAASATWPAPSSLVSLVGSERSITLRQHRKTKSSKVRWPRHFKSKLYA